MLMLVSGSAMLRGGNELSNEMTKSYVAHFGSSLPGVTAEISKKKSRRPVPRTLEADSVSLRSLTIPAAVVKKFHPFQGDVTTTITIAGRTVQRTACGGGVRTYHVRIAGTGLLISVSDVGAAGFAEQELNALRT